jgi:ABC-type Mn2+/Zn2+ transport system ATPase subunit
MSPALRSRGATVVIGGRRVLDDVSFEVARGELACLCGPNGGGKTTFLKAALGLVPLAAGEIEVLGARPGAAASAVGYLPQAKGFNAAFPAHVADVIVANRRGAWPVRVRAADREAARAALGRVGGEPLLVYLARALVNEPALLLLDEPTAGVDARGRAEFLDLLAGLAARGDFAAVLVTHNAAAVRRLAKRVVYLDGRVRAWGAPAEVLDRDWGRTAFSGRDHEGAPASPCEDQE